MEMIAAFFDFMLLGRAKELLRRAVTARLNHSIDERDWLVRYADAKGVSLIEAEADVARHLDDCLTA